MQLKSFAPFELWIMNLPSYGHSMIFKKEILYFLLIIYQSYVAQPVSLYKSLLREEHRAAAFMK